MSNSLLIIILIVSIVLFFWGIAKAVKTQKSIYALAMLPFFIIMAGMFIR